MSDEIMRYVTIKGHDRAGRPAEAVIGITATMPDPQFVPRLLMVLAIYVAIVWGLIFATHQEEPNPGYQTGNTKLEMFRKIQGAHDGP